MKPNWDYIRPVSTGQKWMMRYEICVLQARPIHLRGATTSSETCAEYIGAVLVQLLQKSMRHKDWVRVLTAPHRRQLDPLHGGGAEWLSEKRLQISEEILGVCARRPNAAQAFEPLCASVLRGFC